MTALLARLPSLSLTYRAIPHPQGPRHQTNDEFLDNSSSQYSSRDLPPAPSSSSRKHAFSSKRSAAPRAASPTDSVAKRVSARPALPQLSSGRASPTPTPTPSVSTYSEDGNIHLKISTMTSLLLDLRDRYNNFDERLDHISQTHEGLASHTLETVRKHGVQGDYSQVLLDLRGVLDGIAKMGSSIEAVRGEVSDLTRDVREQRKELLALADRLETMDRKFEVLVTSQAEQMRKNGDVETAQLDIMDQLAMVTKSQNDLQTKYGQLVAVVNKSREEAVLARKGTEKRRQQDLQQGREQLEFGKMMSKLESLEELLATLVNRHHPITDNTHHIRKDTVAPMRFADLDVLEDGEQLTDADLINLSLATIGGSDEDHNDEPMLRQGQIATELKVADYVNTEYRVQAIDRQSRAATGSDNGNDTFYDLQDDSGAFHNGQLNFFDEDAQLRAPPLSTTKRKRTDDDDSDRSDHRIQTPHSVDGWSPARPQATHAASETDNESEYTPTKRSTDKRRTISKPRSFTSHSTQANDFAARRATGRFAFPPRPTPKMLKRAAAAQSPSRRKAKARVVLRKSYGPKPKISERSLPASNGVFKGSGHWPQKAEYTITSRMQEIVCEIRGANSGMTSSGGSLMNDVAQCKGRVHWFCAGLEDDDPSPDGEWLCPDCELAVRNDVPRHTIEVVQQQRCIRGDCLLRAKKRLVRKPHDEERYYPERVIGRRRVEVEGGPEGGKKSEWLLKWIGWSTDWSTWEPRSNIAHLPEMIETFRAECEIQSLDLRSSGVCLLREAKKYFDGATGELKDEYVEHDDEERKDYGAEDGQTEDMGQGSSGAQGQEHIVPSILGEAGLDGAEVDELDSDEG